MKFQAIKHLGVHTETNEAQLTKYNKVRQQQEAG